MQQLPRKSRRPPPYVQRLMQSGSVSVWLVDGSYVRSTIDGDFVGYAHYYSISAIPRDEVWIDAEGAPRELADPETLRAGHRALIERRLMARGMDYEAARTMAAAEARKLHLAEAEPSNPAG
jgi:hypothetical protein